MFRKRKTTFHLDEGRGTIRLPSGRVLEACNVETKYETKEVGRKKKKVTRWLVRGRLAYGDTKFELREWTDVSSGTFFATVLRPMTTVTAHVRIASRALEFCDGMCVYHQGIRDYPGWIKRGELTYMDETGRVLPIRDYAKISMPNMCYTDKGDVFIGAVRAGKVSEVPDGAVDDYQLFSFELDFPFPVAFECLGHKHAERIVLQSRIICIRGGFVRRNMSVLVDGRGLRIFHGTIATLSDTRVLDLFPSAPVSGEGEVDE